VSAPVPLRAAFSLAALATLLACMPASAQITVYEHDSFQGRNFTTDRAVADLQRRGFNDRASSAVVGAQLWEICENSSYGGRCRVLRPGQYASLTAMGMNDRVSSVRMVARSTRPAPDRYAPPPVVATDYRRRKNERLFEARVTGSRAVYGAPEQRCWMETENVAGSDNRVPGALLGAVIGGILGHQVGGGSGRDLATVGGVVAGAVVGANVGGRRGGGQREVQRCNNVPGPTAPTFWDVSYVHRGQEHHVQLAQPPGPTVTVNRAGEPRA
jgi:uncharacterized protein YcfJ